MSLEFSWGSFDDQFVTELADWVGSSTVLEIFAGNGLLASKLAATGVAITSTSTFTGHDGHRDGMHHHVLEIDARQAVRDMGSEHEVLLMSWPPPEESALHATLLWGEDKPVIFIGEVTRPELGFGGLGGCASDLFFELTNERGQFSTYQSRRSGLDSAAIRYLVPGALELWRKHVEETRTRPFGHLP